VHGRHGLVQTLLAAEPVDEFNVWTFPLVLDQGKPLFGEDAVPAALRVTSSRVTGKGVIVTTNQSAGPVAQQTAAVEDGKVVV